jgi:hypothetical protein
LWGSGGRGDDDAVGDWGIFVAWHDASEIAGLDAGWFRRFGDVLWRHEDPFNAPNGGRYVGDRILRGPERAAAFDPQRPQFQIPENRSRLDRSCVPTVAAGGTVRRRADRR